MPTPNHPQVREVKAVPGTGKESPRRTAGIVAGRATGRASVRRSALILKNTDRSGVTQIGIKNCTT